MDNIMIAFHGKAATRRKYLKRIEDHRKADEIAKGFYWERGKGCAVGCTLHSDQHSEYEAQLGIPESLAHLEDAIFESLPLKRAKLWPGQFLAAIQPGADLSLVTKRFLAFMVRDFADTSEKSKPICLRMADLMDRSLAGDEPTATQWDEAARTARAARAARAAWDARAAWAAWAAWAARDTWYAWAARYAWAAWDTRDTRDTRAARAAWAATVIRHADKLLQLLREAPVINGVHK